MPNLTTLYANDLAISIELDFTYNGECPKTLDLDRWTFANVPNQTNTQLVRLAMRKAQTDPYHIHGAIVHALSVMADSGASIDESCGLRVFVGAGERMSQRAIGNLARYWFSNQLMIADCIGSSYAKRGIQLIGEQRGVNLRHAKEFSAEDVSAKLQDSVALMQHAALNFHTLISRGAVCFQLFDMSPSADYISACSDLCRAIVARAIDTKAQQWQGQRQPKGKRSKDLQVILNNCGLTSADGFGATRAALLERAAR